MYFIVGHVSNEQDMVTVCCEYFRVVIFHVSQTTRKYFNTEIHTDMCITNGNVV